MTVMQDPRLDETGIRFNAEATTARTMRVAPRWSDRTASRLSGPARRTCVDLEQVVRLAWESGLRYQPVGLAEVVEDIRLSDIAPPATTAEQRVQQRLRLFERCAEDFHAKHGTKPWPGRARAAVALW